jgi:ABC-type nitrate/sulfonate/bicarbonate transport system permease component
MSVVPVLRRVGLFLGLPVVLVLTWWFASADSVQFYQPPLSKILAVFPSTWTWQRFDHDVVPSLTRLAIGYTIALGLGISLGALIGSYRSLRALLEPVLEFLRAIPPPVLVPIFLLIAGIENTSKILVIASGCVWPVLLNTVEGVRAVDEVLGDTCRSYRIGGTRRLFTFVLRSASPQIMAGARQALSLGLILMVISELKAAHDGIGFAITEFKDGFQIPEMYSGVLVLGAIGVTLALLFWLVERRVLGWYRGARAAERSAP